MFELLTRNENIVHTVNRLNSCRLSVLDDEWLLKYISNLEYIK